MAGQAPFQPQDFAMGKRPQAMGGFTEENIPSADVGPTFSEQDLPSSQIMDFVKGTTDSASDEALVESTKHLQTPEAIQSLMLKGKADSGDEGGFTDSLTTSEKVALGLLAIMPLIGGAIGGDDGALIGAGAGGQGLATFGKFKFKEDERDRKALAAAGALKSKITREDEKFDRSEAGRDKRAGLRAAATTKAQKLALEKEDRRRVQDFKKDWKADKIRANYDDVRVADSKLQIALKGKGGVANLTAIVAFQKGLDPGSVVREGEVALVKQAQGIIGRMENVLGAAHGQTLSEGAKAQMSKLSSDFVRIHADLVRERAKNRRQDAVDFGLNPDMVVPEDFFKTLPGSKAPPPPGDDSNSQTIEAPTGPRSKINRQRDASGNLIPR